MENLVSVIIPVYNSQQYVRICAESVLAQTYSAFEIILIEDGSEDFSLNVCKELCEKDKRIRVIRQEHKGVSAARNLGIEEAKGKYLFFMDSDDLIHPQLFESLYKLLEKGHAAMATEGVHSGTEEDFRETAVRKPASCRVVKSYYLGSDKAIKYINRQPFCTVFGNMISRKAIGTIRFREDLRQAEDTLFVYELMAGGADIAVLGFKWYYYRKHKNNSSKNFSPEACRDRYKAARYICSHELRNGREKNAVYREWDIILTIAEWYRRGRKEQNMELTEFAENFMRKEKERKIFRSLSWWMKLYYCLFLYCYPLAEGIRKCSIKAIKWLHKEV